MAKLNEKLTYKYAGRDFRLTGRGRERGAGSSDVKPFPCMRPAPTMILSLFISKLDVPIT